MRVLWFLGLLCLVFAQEAVNLVDTVPAQQPNIKDLVDELNLIDEQLKGTVVDQYKQAYGEKKVIQDEIAAQLQMSAQELMQKWLDRLNEVAKLRKDLEAQWEIEKQQKIDDLKTELNKLQADYVLAKAAEKAAIQKKWEDAKQAFSDAIEKKKQEKLAQYKEVKDYLTEVNAVYEQHLADVEAAKTARKDEIKAKGAAFFDQYKAQKAQLDAQLAALKDQYTTYAASKDQLKDLVGSGLKTGFHEVVAEKLEEKLEDNLNKEIKEVVKEEIWKKTHPKAAPFLQNTGAAPGAQAVAQPKATLLDTLTGASAWETVAWVLLGLCILLSVALIAMIVFQVSQRGKYDQIDGHNTSDRRFSERAPLHGGSTAPPLSYTEVGSKYTPNERSPLLAPTVPRYAGLPPKELSYPEPQAPQTPHQTIVQTPRSDPVPTLPPISEIEPAKELTLTDIPPTEDAHIVQVPQQKEINPLMPPWVNASDPAMKLQASNESPLADPEPRLMHAPPGATTDTPTKIQSEFENSNADANARVLQKPQEEGIDPKIDAEFENILEGGEPQTIIDTMPAEHIKPSDVADMQLQKEQELGVEQPMQVVAPVHKRLNISVETERNELRGVEPNVTLAPQYEEGAAAYDKQFPVMEQEESSDTLEVLVDHTVPERQSVYDMPMTCEGEHAPTTPLPLFAAAVTQPPQAVAVEVESPASEADISLAPQYEESATSYDKQFPVMEQQESAPTPETAVEKDEDDHTVPERQSVYDMPMICEGDHAPTTPPPSFADAVTQPPPAVAVEIESPAPEADISLAPQFEEGETAYDKQFPVMEQEESSATPEVPVEKEEDDHTVPERQSTYDMPMTCEGELAPTTPPPSFAAAVTQPPPVVVAEVESQAPESDISLAPQFEEGATAYDKQFPVMEQEESASTPEITVEKDEDDHTVPERQSVYDMPMICEGDHAPTTPPPSFAAAVTQPPPAVAVEIESPAPEADISLAPQFEEGETAYDKQFPVMEQEESPATPEVPVEKEEDDHTVPERQSTYDMPMTCEGDYAPTTPQPSFAAVVTQPPPAVAVEIESPAPEANISLAPQFEEGETAYDKQFPVIEQEESAYTPEIQVEKDEDDHTVPERQSAYDMPMICEGDHAPTTPPPSFAAAVTQPPPVVSAEVESPAPEADISLAPQFEEGETAYDKQFPVMEQEESSATPGESGKDEGEPVVSERQSSFDMPMTWEGDMTLSTPPPSYAATVTLPVPDDVAEEADLPHGDDGVASEGKTGGPAAGPSVHPAGETQQF